MDDNVLNRIDRIIGFFDDDDKLTLTVFSEEEQRFNMLPGVPYVITIDIKRTCMIIAETVKPVQLKQLFFTVVNLPSREKPVNVSDIKVIHHPEQGVIIAFDFKKAFEKINDVPCPQVEILNTDNSQYVVKESSENFQWRGTHLYCKITVGKRRMRVKLTEGQSWSKWLPFDCMTYKRYRRQLNH